MNDERLRELVVGEHILTFDGRILDVFDGHHGAIRVHVARMRLDVTDGRRGTLVVKVTSERRNSPIETLMIEPEDRPAAESLLGKIQTATVSAERERA